MKRRSFKNLSIYLISIFCRWGVYDLDDSCTGAQHLADTGKVDGKQLCIDGGSAGGYTTLAAITFRNTFKAGKLYMSRVTTKPT
jgi:dipeptidyl aminopeptidase/acylaminoacyl peptidase